jgi:hypothetical protein
MQTHVTSNADAGRAPQSVAAVQTQSMSAAATSPLERVQQMTDSSPQAIQLKKYAAMAAAAQPLPPQPPASGVVQRAYELCTSGDITHDEDHRAKKVRAENIRGQTLGAAANSPSVAPFGWNEMKHAGHTLANTGGNNSHYNAVRAHLMNGRLGGPGYETWNLAPAPAKINSMMSAGPETAAKNLVDAGNKVWIETTLSYHNSSTTATDFTSVVPNHISMSWGVMGKAGMTWTSPIDLPVAPLQGAEVLEYQNWKADKTVELVTKLSTQSDQVKAQAFDLVAHDSLKFAILNAYPRVYLSMQDTAKGEILYRIAEKDRLPFLQSTGIYANPESLIAEAVMPLAEANHAIEAQKLFATLSDDEQRAVLISWKNDLLRHLGRIGESWSVRDFKIFSYNSHETRANLVHHMDKDELQTFLKPLTKPNRFHVLHTWNTFILQPADPLKALRRMAAKVSKLHFGQYRAMIGKIEKADNYKAGRPSRQRKPPKGK